MYFFAEKTLRDLLDRDGFRGTSNRADGGTLTLDWLVYSVGWVIRTRRRMAS